MQYEEFGVGGAAESRSVGTGPQPWQARRRLQRSSREPLVMAPWRAQPFGVSRRKSERNHEEPEPASVGAST